MATRGTPAWRAEMWGRACRPQSPTRVFFFGFDSAGFADVDWRAAPAMKALDAVFAKHRYRVRRRDTGGYSCRPVTGGTAPSVHAYGLAVDVNYENNPYQLRSISRSMVTDMPREMVDEILRILTVEGVQVFRAGMFFKGDFVDPMHFELMVSPGELAAGIPGFSGAGNYAPVDLSASWKLPGVRMWDGMPRGRAELRPTVARLQVEMARAGSEFYCFPDGYFGRTTVGRLRLYQRARMLVVDGVCGPATWSKLTS